MERVAFRPVRGASPATLLVTSFAVSFLLQNLALLIFGAPPRRAIDSRRLCDESFSVGSLLRSRSSTSSPSVVTALLLVALGAVPRARRDRRADARRGRETSARPALLGVQREHA